LPLSGKYNSLLYFNSKSDYGDPVPTSGNQTAVNYHAIAGSKWVLGICKAAWLVV